NNEPAFDLDGSIEVSTPNENEIQIIRKNKEQTSQAELKANLKDLTYKVVVNGQEVKF
ncbi:MAG: sucrose phosphorylase, partial [Lactobacillus crispatus]|nr:sucrose phosphorylase [Lactobacillus crispatus]